MTKNIGIKESHIRSIAGVVIVLFALLVVQYYVARILLAVIAAVLAGTAFIRYCPINAVMKRDSRDKFEIEGDEEITTLATELSEETTEQEQQAKLSEDTHV